MRFRDRDQQREQMQGDPSDGNPADDNLDAMRDAGDELFRSADAAIQQALSGDSLQYNRESQQAGGQ